MIGAPRWRHRDGTFERLPAGCGLLSLEQAVGHLFGQHERPEPPMPAPPRLRRIRFRRRDAEAFERRRAERAQAFREERALAFHEEHERRVAFVADLRRIMGLPPRVES